MFKCLRKDGVGSESRHTEGISDEEENLLWQSNVLNCDDPVVLQRAVFYYNGKMVLLAWWAGTQGIGCFTVEKVT